MNRQHYYLALLLLLLPITLAASGAGRLGYTKAKPLVIGLDLDYAPLEYVNHEGMPSGYDVVFTKELMKRMGMVFTYQPNIWENIKDDIMGGRVDLGMMVYSPYRTNILSYSRAVLRLYYQIVFRKNDNSHYDMRNLSGKNIAFMESRPVSDTLTKAGAVLHVVTDLPQAMQQLNDGRYDAIICYRYQANYLIKNFNLKNLEANDLTLSPREYCYVSKNHELIDSINVFLEQMEDEGVIEEVYGSVMSRFGKREIPQWVYVSAIVSIILFLMVVIIQQRRHQRQLQVEVERAQRSERMKTVFLGNVSHALRTPLNAIIGFSDVVIADEQMPVNERTNLLKLINKNGQQLLYFINELLQLSNFESSQAELNYERCNLADLMKEYGDEVRPLLHEGVELRIKETPLMLNIDTSVMHAYINQLLYNSVKHTHQGYIEVSYELDKKQNLHLVVTDTGEGLPENLRENIFELLSDRNTYIQPESPGLGLSICKAIIDMLHGQIGAHSESGKGTTIWAIVPKPPGA